MPITARQEWLHDLVCGSGGLWVDAGSGDDRDFSILAQRDLAYCADTADPKRG